MKKHNVMLPALLLALTMALTTGCTAGAANGAEPPVTLPAETQQPTEAPTETQQPAQAPIETQQPAEAEIPAAYAAILAQYADAEANGYYQSVDAADRDAAFGVDTALEWRINPRPAQYALCDLDGDGTHELIIAAAAEDGEYVNYDIWAMDGDTAVRLFDFDFGYRATFAVYADGLIAVTFSNSAFESGVDMYRVDGAKARLAASFVTRSSEDNPDTVEYLSDGAPLTQEEWDAKIAEFTAAGMLTIAFIPVVAG